jgi:hypothetical protein
MIYRSISKILPIILHRTTIKITTTSIPISNAKEKSGEYSKHVRVNKEKDVVKDLHF